MAMRLKEGWLTFWDSLEGLLRCVAGRGAPPGVLPRRSGRAGAAARVGRAADRLRKRLPALLLLALAEGGRPLVRLRHRGAALQRARWPAHL